MQILVIPFSFYIHSFKLKTDAIIFKTKYVIHISNTAGNIQILVIPFSFYVDNFKLKTEAIID